MKVLTLREPWASLVLSGSKTIETRSWQTRYRGEILIHAAVRRADARMDELTALVRGPLNYGLIIARCELTGCALIDEAYARRLALSDPINYMCGDFTPGRYAWTLENVRALARPVPARGHLGLWNWEPDARD